jgi:hypothetical protein
MMARPAADLYPQPGAGGLAVEPQRRGPSFVEPAAPYLLAGLLGPPGMALERAAGDHAAARPLAVTGLGCGDVQPYQVGRAAAQPGQRRHRAAEPGRRGRQVHHDRRRRAERQAHHAGPVQQVHHRPDQPVAHPAGQQAHHRGP